MSEQENIELARNATKAFQRGDVEAFLAFLDPDVEIYTPPDVPNAVHAHGHDAYLKWVGTWLDAWDVYEVEPVRFDAIDDRHLIVDIDQRGVGKGSGVEVRMRVYYMLEIRDRTAIRFHFYMDRDQAVEAAQAAG